MRTRAISLVLIGALVLSLVGTALISTPASAATCEVRAWVKSSTAVVDVSSGKFDANGTAGASVIYEGGTTYKMWYTGRTVTGFGLGEMAIGYATSSNGTSWAKQNSGNAVLQGSAGQWDARGVAFPTVVKDGNTYRMWYTGYSGTGANVVSKIGYATSTDGGLTWTKYPSNVSPTAVVSPGSAATWESMGVGAPNVMLDGTTYKMWYTGVKSDLLPSVGYATASSGNITTWTKSSLNPVLAGGIGGASVIKDSGVYRMWFTSQDILGVPRIGYASSTNGTAWAKASSPALTASYSFESSGVASPSVVKVGNVYKMWYTGLDSSSVPHIGYAAPDAATDTISEVITAASSSDTIIVHPGTYPEQLTINKANLIVMSWDIAALPIIDATGGYDPAVVISAAGTTFKGFGFTGASNRGIHITSAVTSGTTTLLFNNIEGTAQFGVGSFNGVKNDGAGTVAATNNWWGNASGPAGIGEGSGSALLGNATYDSWLTRDVLTVLQDILGYIGWNITLGSGWNVFSTPVALDSAGDTYGELVGLGNGLKIHPTSPAYYFNAATQEWLQALDIYVLSPVDAIYIRMTDADKALVLASPSVSSAQKSLVAGWNLVSLSSTGVKLQANTALTSIADKFAHLVSPSLNNQAGWVYTVTETVGTYVDTTTPGWMHIGKGYWVYMNSADTLGGFGFTPLPSPVPSSW